MKKEYSLQEAILLFLNKEIVLEQEITFGELAEGMQTFLDSEIDLRKLTITLHKLKKKGYIDYSTAKTNGCVKKITAINKTF